MKPSLTLSTAVRRRRRRERLFAVASVISLALCLLTAGWAWRQFLEPGGGHAILLVPGGPPRACYSVGRPAVYWRGLVTTADPRSFHLGYVGLDLVPKSLDPSRTFHDVGARPEAPALPYAGSVDHGLGIDDRMDIDLPGWLSTERCGLTVGDFGRGTRAVAIDLPYQPLIVLLAMPPLAWVIRSDRRYRLRVRPRPARCLACGYDLRASPERCPECGEPNVVPPAARAYTLGGVARAILGRRRAPIAIATGPSTSA